MVENARPGRTSDNVALVVSGFNKPVTWQMCSLCPLVFHGNNKVRVDQELWFSLTMLVKRQIFANSNIE